MRDKVTTVSTNHNGKETERIVKYKGSWVAGEWREESGVGWGGGGAVVGVWRGLGRGGGGQSH